MLIFRDSILGFVSGIQLSANNMLRVGDWIAMPKVRRRRCGGGVSLTTVKIRNWDNTVTTVPPYLLVSRSFPELAGHAAHGRPPRQALDQHRHDQRAVLHARDDRPLPRQRAAAQLHRDGLQHNDAFNASRNPEPGMEGIDGRRLTNLGVFRAYLVEYLRTSVRA